MKLKDRTSASVSEGCLLNPWTTVSLLESGCSFAEGPKCRNRGRCVQYSDTRVHLSCLIVPLNQVTWSDLAHIDCGTKGAFTHVAKTVCPTTKITRHKRDHCFGPD